MTLVRAVGRGLALPGHTGTVLRRTAVSYYGQSFGGIYGVMLGGTDPMVPVLAPNVSGGPISEIARLSPAFRPLVTQDLGQRQPSLLNGGYDGFTESMPLRGDAPARLLPRHGVRWRSSRRSPTRRGSTARAARRPSPRCCAPGPRRVRPPSGSCCRTRSGTRPSRTRPPTPSCSPGGCSTGRACTATTRPPTRG